MSSATASWEGGREADGVVGTKSKYANLNLHSQTGALEIGDLPGVIMYFQDHPALTGTPPSVGELTILLNPQKNVEKTILEVFITTVTKEVA